MFIFILFFSEVDINHNYQYEWMMMPPAPPKKLDNKKTQGSVFNKKFLTTVGWQLRQLAVDLLIDPLCSRNRTQEDNNYCDVIFAASLCSLCCQSFGAHSRLFYGVPNYAYNICVAHNVPQSIAAHYLQTNHILFPLFPTMLILHLTNLAFTFSFTRTINKIMKC